MILRPALVVFCLAVALGAPVISLESSRSAKRKLERIAEGKAPSGSSIILAEDEINSYLRYDFADDIPAGISRPHIRLEPDRVSGSAMVDFVEWKAQRGEPPGMLLSWLLRCERRVDVVCHYTSADGYGRVDVESVKISGVPISAGAVTFLIENLVQPRYPAAVVGRPAPLGYNLKQVRIDRGRAVVVAR